MARSAHNAATTALRLDGPRPDPAAGVFETTLVVDGNAVEVDAHLTRLEASLLSLYGTRLPLDAGSRIAEGASGLALGRLRLTVVPGAEPTVRVAEVGPAIVFPSDGGSVAPVTVPGGIGGHKWADRRLLDRAAEELAPATPLLLDAEGTVLEGSRSNVFAVRDGVLITPPADDRILPGVARARAIELAGAVGIEVVERPLALKELAEADEVFMTGGVRGVEPVADCEGLGQWDSGEFTARISAELRRAWLGADASS